ncbi:MAG: hypothetical protein PHG27_04780 [Massilibacteroides sp.]|nr:hypothetical protein [Massilibacteroides sp.]MDD3061636.1 hypothetical protein [Massilibacteroides sp.]MDD4114901.1 hypothetical protein [Massilibacteroides sp.]MDD4659980.1 hypothetical protein [Massilibacteroides sp.]
MLKRDFILVQIEELGKVIAQLIDNRNHGVSRKTDQLIESIYSTLKIDKDFLLSHTPEEILQLLDGEDNAGLQRMEIAAKTLLEEGYLVDDNHGLLKKAREILLYIQKHDRTFSFERINLLDETQNLLAKF